MKPDLPLVSVVIPVRNAERFVVESIESALAQTHQVLEVVVVDNDSSDGSVDRVKELSDQRIRIEHVPAGGVSAARNHGVSVSQGQFIGFLDADDVWLETRVSRLIAELNERSECAVAYSWVDRIQNGQRSTHSRQSVRGDVLTHAVERHLVGTASNIFVRRSAFDEVGGFDESLDFAEDWDLLVRLAERFEFASVEEVLLLYRRHPNNSIHNTRAIRRCNRVATARWKKTIGGVDHRRAARIRGINVNRFLAEVEALSWTTTRDRVRCIRSLLRYVVFAATAPPNSPAPRLEPSFVRNTASLLAKRESSPTSRAGELASDGLIRQCGTLSDQKLVQELLRDEPLFSAALVASTEAGETRVPYLNTSATSRTAFDPNMAAYVSDALGTDEWVMWGANIRRGVPNAAQYWHVDQESRLWPSLTVVVGVSGCHEQNPTSVIPRSQGVVAMPPRVPFADAGRAVAAARSENPDCVGVATFEGFGNGRFYGFDASCWHAGNPDLAEDRVLLFTHFHAASDPRIPLMGDYRVHAWFDEPSPYISSSDWPDRTKPPPTTPMAYSHVETRLAEVPRERGRRSRYLVQKLRYVLDFIRRLTRWIVGLAARLKSQ